MKSPAIISGAIMLIQSGSGGKLRPSCGVYRAVNSIGNLLSLAFRQKRRRKSPVISDGATCRDLANIWLSICELEEAHWDYLYLYLYPCPPGGPSPGPHVEL